MVTRNISLQRAEDILDTLNPKFKWYYYYNSKEEEFVFYSESKFLKYVVSLKEILSIEQKNNILSHLFSLTASPKFKKIKFIK